MHETTCRDCGGPIHFVPLEGLWYHDSLIDTLDCDADEIRPEPVEV